MVQIGLPASAVVPSLLPELLPLVIPALVGAVAYLIKRRADALERRRELCARALACVFEWLEVPYRIRRRQDGDANARAAVATAINDLQQRLAFHQAWFRVEIPRLAPTYEALCSAAKQAAGVAAQESWKNPGISDDADMNIGNLGIARPQAHEEAFTEAVRRELSLWRGLIRW